MGVICESCFSSNKREDATATMQPNSKGPQLLEPAMINATTE